MQFDNYVDTQPAKRFERAMWYIHDIKSGMLQVRKNEILLRKCSGGSAQLRERWSPRSLRDLITTTVHLNCKVGNLSSQKKIKIFQRRIVKNIP